MGAVRPDLNPDLHHQVTEGNLRRQFDLLRDMVSVGIAIPFGITTRIIDTIHVHTAAHLVEKPGRYREEECRIVGSTHIPPTPNNVKENMIEFVLELKRRWDVDQMFVLAAFAFWRFCWIHPYEDGNGRTARAICYLVICLKLKNWLPGVETLPIIIKRNRESYTSALRHADNSAAAGALDLEPLAKLLTTHTREQLKSGVIANQSA